AAAYTEPPANDTRRGEKAPRGAGAGPGPWPPARVEMPPATRAWVLAGRDCPPAAAAGTSAVTVAAAVMTATRPARPTRERSLEMSVPIVMEAIPPFSGDRLSAHAGGDTSNPERMPGEGPGMSWKRDGAARGRGGGRVA